MASSDLYCLKKYVDDLYSLCKKRDSKLVLNSSNLSGDPRYSISINGEDLIIIRSETEEIGSSNIKIPKITKIIRNSSKTNKKKNNLQ